MDVYFGGFIDQKQNDWTRFLFITKSLYNNIKNAIIGHISFNLNYVFYSHIFFKDDINYHSNFHLAKKLTKKLKDKISICQQN